MVLASGQDATAAGVMGPAGGGATIEKVAIAAVMAGCLTEHLPVVIAAVQDRFAGRVRPTLCSQRPTALRR